MTRQKKKSSRIDPSLPWRDQEVARKRGGFGVQGRVLLSFSSIFIAGMCVTAWLVMNDVADRFRSRSEQELRYVSRLLAASSAPFLRDGQAGVELLRSRASDLVRESDIHQIEFRDSDGTLLLALPGGIDLVPPQRPDTVVSQPTDHYELLVIRQDVIDQSGWDARFGSPTAQIGSVTVGLSTEATNSAVQSLQLLILSTGVAIAVLTIPLAALLIRSVFAPVRELTKSAQKVMQGELVPDFRYLRRDVIGDLARAFNELVTWVRQYRDQLEANTRELARVNKELEGKVEARNLQLEAANDRLAGEIAEKEDFLRAVSHDLNAPLRNIGGMVTMLLMKSRESLPPDVVARLERIKKNVDVETDLINELLELSRIKGRRGKIELVETEKMIWDLRGLFENDLKTRHIELILASTLPDLVAEKARIRQVFQNLVDNAIKYMGDRPIREVRIGCVSRVSEVEFFVSDTGTGIHPQDIDKVFFVFRRGSSEQTQKTAGKGVGLASVKSIVETYAGKIWVESAVNEGTTFRFTVNGRYVPSLCGLTAQQLIDDYDRGEDSQRAGRQPGGLAKAA